MIVVYYPATICAVSRLLLIPPSEEFHDTITSTRGGRQSFAGFLRSSAQRRDMKIECRGTCLRK